ncbi:membrane protein insertase YidC [Quatrionicoccus australiensis]|uniref:membrane protein insertase YidC n=1 Tax=Quatrionicoccus australiensis TaxID=138118 RepID=UPI001CFA8C0F|nr:membrane protein insertase YidC [Quatrionicoccus australiensis]MCB4360039.1 membrane protein insertase YidC [Quatrionicoccus australiensis]
MDTRRLILVLIFTFSSFMLWENWQKYNQPKPAEAVAANAAAGAAPTPSAALHAGSVPGAPVVAPAATVATAETFTITTDLVKATISSVGGDLVELELLKYKAHEDKEKTFQLFEATHQYAAQSGLTDGLPSHRSIFKRVAGPSSLAEGSDELKVRLEAATTDGIKVAKILTFKRASYSIDVAWEITNGSDKAFAPHAYFQLQRDNVSPAGETKMVSTFTGPAVYTEADKYQKISFDDIADNKAKFNKTADNGWLAMVQHYFVAALVPKDKTPHEFYMRKMDGSNVFQAGVIVPVAEIAPGAKGETSVTLYAGPQEQSALKQVAAGLDLVVDYGWLTMVAAPIFWALQAIHSLVGNWGWAIVVLTIIIKAIFFPLSAASYKSMAKMKVLTPRLMQLKERFADDKQRLNQEMMKMYQTEKVNPLGGCLPILVQIPVFISLYWVLLGAVEMRDAPWILWIKDLASADPYFILPVIMMASMFLQTKLNPTPPDPIQAKVMMAMPLIFGVMFFWFPAGLVLYWVVNNVLSIAQQWHITRAIDAGGKAANDPKA